MNQNQLPLTMLSGAFSPSETSHAIGRSLSFLSSATFAMWVQCDEELKDQGEGLQLILAHLAALQIHSSQLLDEQVSQLSQTNCLLEQQLAQYQQLCSQLQSHIQTQQGDHNKYEQQVPDVAIVAQVVD